MVIMHIGLLLLLVFIAVPLIEIGLFIEIGGIIGTIPTISLIVFTAVLGAMLVQAQAQGLSTLRRLRASSERGELPAMEMFEGACLLIAGAMLLTPGFFTDTLGFLCLVPPLRRALIRAMLRRHLYRPAGPAGQSRGPGDAPRTIEGEYTREDD